MKDEALGGTRILELEGWAEHQDSTKQQGKERGIVCVWGEGTELELGEQVIRLPKPELSVFLKPRARGKMLSGAGLRNPEETSQEFTGSVDLLQQHEERANIPKTS